MTKNQLTLVGIVVLGILVLIAAKALYPKNDRDARSETKSTVESAWNSLVQAHSTHITANLALTLPQNTTQLANQPIIDIAIETEGDAIWRERPSYVGTFTISTKGRGMQLFTDGEIYILPEFSVFNIKNLPTLLNPSGTLQGKWTKVATPLLRATNPELITPTFANIFQNWVESGTENSSVRYEKTFSEEDEKAAESAFNFTASNSQGLHVLARLLKHFTVDKAEAWVTENTQELTQLKFHFTNPADQNQQATLQFMFSEQGKEVQMNAPNEEATVQPEIFAQLFGEPKPLPSPTPTPKK